MPTEKLDVTKRVFGKVENGQINLYDGNEVIGTIPFTQGPTLDNRYEFANGQFFKYEESAPKPGEQYVDCDEGGWC